MFVVYCVYSRWNLSVECSFDLNVEVFVFDVFMPPNFVICFVCVGAPRHELLENCLTTQIAQFICIHYFSACELKIVAVFFDKYVIVTGHFLWSFNPRTCNFCFLLPSSRRANYFYVSDTNLLQPNDKSQVSSLVLNCRDDLSIYINSVSYGCSPGLK